MTQSRKLDNLQTVQILRNLSVVYSSELSDSLDKTNHIDLSLFIRSSIFGWVEPKNPILCGNGFEI